MEDFYNYIFINRLINGNKETNGILTYVSENYDAHTFFTLELPWKDNDPNISHIPDGTYKYEKWESPTFGTTVLRLLNVPDRSNILIHPANYVSQLRGCVAIGRSLRDINNDQLLDVTTSRDSISELVNAVPETGFVKITTN